VPVSALQKVLQQLLSEGVHIRDLRTILEALADEATRSRDPDALTAAARAALSGAIVQQIFGTAQELPVFSLDPSLEAQLLELRPGPGAEVPGLAPAVADRLVREAAALAERREQLGEPAVILAPATLRALLSRYLRRAGVRLQVLALSEIPDDRIVRVIGALGAL
jgi:flagellar biosynthesis protein FlhA